MRYLILSDIHANLEALESVLADADRAGFDRAVVLGDIVGYGGSPNEVIERIRALRPTAVVRGNHDKAVAGITEGESFNDLARQAALWTRRALTAEHLAYLRDLPQGPMDAGGFLVSHGSPLDEEEYVLGEIDAARAFEERVFPVAFFGHTHFACCFSHSQGRTRLRALVGDDIAFELRTGERYLINPGSIGQPRDHNPKSAYAIFDTDARELRSRRVAYDIDAAQARIEACGLPAILGERLSLGV